MEGNKLLGYSALGVGGLFGAYMLWKHFQSGDIVDDTSVTWVFPQPGSWSKHLPDNYTGIVFLNELEVPLALQGVYLFDMASGTWLYWGPGAPGTTLSTLVAGNDYVISVADAGEGWPLEWMIPLMPPLP